MTVKRTTQHPARKPAKRKPAKRTPAKRKSVRPPALKTLPMRRFLVQLSTHGPGYQQPQDDRSELKQFVFIVQAARVEDIGEPLRDAIEAARKDDTGMLKVVKNLHIDWIIDPAKPEPGLVWECATLTEVKRGPAQITRASGAYSWHRKDDEDSNMFANFEEEKDAVDEDDEAPATN